MKVYVVVCYDDRYEFGGYEEPCVVAVFLARETAEACAAINRHTDKYGYQTHALVSEHIVGDPEGGAA